MADIAQTATIHLVDSRLTPLEHVRDVHGLAARAVREASAASRVLKYFDPYGSLVLNQCQMADFLADWADSKHLVNSDQDKAAWEAIQRLAQRVSESNAEFLAIVGD